MRRLLLLNIILLFTSVLFAEPPKSWQDLEQSCFRIWSKVSSPDTGTIKVRTRHRSQMFFIQNKNVRPYKVFEYGSEQYINYNVISLIGVDQKNRPKMNVLFDGNHKTTLKFDPYNENIPEIIIDAGKLLKARQFRTNLHYSGKANIRYFISKDNSKYILIDKPQNYDWRFLKIRFERWHQKDVKKYPIAIKELVILTTAPTSYLVKSESHSDIELFSGFECEDDDYRKLFSQVTHRSRKTPFSIHSKTKRHDQSWIVNPTYDSDFDDDQILNSTDNCPFKANKNQLDSDQDLVGDVCDFDNETRNYFDKDTDNDGIGDSLDNCSYIFNPKQQDSNADKRGDLCSDDDNDGFIGVKDNCVNISNTNQKDININGIGDACEFDKDNDGIFDSVDNCINAPNNNQADEDKDRIGDACDNCNLYNPRQLDKNSDSVGDVCEQKAAFLLKNDKDGDNIIDFKDNCKKIPNPDQADEDKDGIGDVCDNCAKLQNPLQQDRDKNSVGDMCEDGDQDGIVGFRDNCMYFPNANQKDSDNNGVGNICEDSDRDGLVAFNDNCPFVFNKDQWDNDNDGIGDKCDEKDDRLLESNRWLVIGIIVLITIIFGVLIFGMVKKLKKM